MAKRLTQRDCAANAVYWRKRFRSLPRWRLLARRKAEQEALYWEILTTMKGSGRHKAP